MRYLGKDMIVAWVVLLGCIAKKFFLIISARDARKKVMTMLQEAMISGQAASNKYVDKTNQTYLIWSHCWLIFVKAAAKIPMKAE